MTYINIPTKIQGLSDIVQVSPAKFGDYSLTAFLDKYGHVWVTGNGQQYTPVILSNINEVKQVSSTMAENYIYALKNEGTVWKIGLDSVPTQVYGLSDIESIATGYEHSLALKNDGSIWSWGGNHFGELGLGYYSSKVTTPERIPNFNASFVGGSSIMNSFAIDSNGVAWSWGYDGVGLLGDGYNYISNGYVLNRGSNVPVKILFDEEPPIVTANPPAGNYNSSQNITLNSSELAYILYTTDGTEPSTNNPTIYTQPITISETTTLRFMAIDAGGHRSEVYTANYIIGAIPPKVFMNTAEILDSSDMLITLTSSETEAAIYYTLDGTVPTQNSMQYNSPITLSAGQNLKIKAIDQAGNMSPTYQFSFSDLISLTL